MRVFRDLSHASLSTSSVVTIGNFDGVHRGHQALLGHCRQLAGDSHEVAVVTFEPLPQSWFDPERAPARLTGPAEKLRLLRKPGVDLVWMMRFNGQLASMQAPEFVERVLVGSLAARYVVLGGDFRFGKNRAGDLVLLREMGARYGFETVELDAVNDGEEKISSTAVRQRLAAGDLQGAAELLGRPYRLMGHVLRGRQLGRKLGYPTANVRPYAGSSALSGIFAVRARGEDGAWHDGVANLGHRPAVGGGELLLEVHLFDFSADLYGQRLETEFVHKIRDEQNFSGLDALVAQMAKDEQQARAALAVAGD